MINTQDIALKADARLIEQNQRLLRHLNTTRQGHAEIKQLLNEIIGRPLAEGTMIRPPFYTELGRNISIGHHVLINSNVTLSDFNFIIIGNYVEIDSGAMAINIKFSI